jgi:hypothetical protein
MTCGVTLAARCARLLLVVASLAPAAAAQQKLRFDPARQLDGYDEAYWGGQRRSYEIEVFEQESGALITQARLDELRRLWVTEQERAAALIETCARDPHVRFMTELDWNLEQHPFFRRVAYTVDDEARPIVLLIQAASKDPEVHALRVARFYRSWLQRVAECFERDYVRQGGLKLRDDHGTYVFAILASKGDYDNYIRAVQEPGLYASRAHYDPELRIGVTYDDPFTQRGATEEQRRRAAMHELVHALQHAHNQGRDGPPADTWLAEGLANHISSYTTRAQADADPLQQFDEDSLRQLSVFARDGDERQRLAVLFSLSDLIGVTSYGGLHARALACGVPFGLVMQGFYAEATLFVQFLSMGHGARYRDNLHRYLAALMNGESGPDAFLAAMAPTTLETLEQEFTDFLRKESVGRLKSSGNASLTLSPSLMTGTDDEPQAASASANAPAGAAAGAGGAGGAQDTTCAAMAKALDEPDMALALAVGAASKGALGAALERLAAAAPAAGPRSWRGRRRWSAPRWPFRQG